MCLKLLSPPKNLFIFVVYCRVTLNLSEIEEFYWCLSKQVSLAKQQGNVLVFGDFNARLGDISGDIASSKTKSLFINFVETLGFCNLNQTIAFGKPSYV